MEGIYFKSFREGERGLEISTSDGEGIRRTSQTLKEVLETGKLKPNTTHPVGWERLCTSRVFNGYDGNHRPDGILFITKSKPGYCIPFDLMALTNVNNFTASEHGAEFLSGYEQFVFENEGEMREAFPTHKEAITALNEFRQQYGLKPVKPDEMRYNEVCFTDEINITPVAVVGSDEAVETGKEYGLRGYKSVRDYLSANQAEEVVSF